VVAQPASSRVAIMAKKSFFTWGLTQPGFSRKRTLP
jgi:hypothetical protein